MKFSQIIRKTWSKIDKIIQGFIKVFWGKFLGLNYKFSARVGVFVKTENLLAKQHLFFSLCFIYVLVSKISVQAQVFSFG